MSARSKDTTGGLIWLLGGVAVTAGGALYLLLGADLRSEADVTGLPPDEALAELDSRADLAPHLVYYHAQLLAEDGQAAEAEAVLTTLQSSLGTTEAILTARADLALRGGDDARALQLLQQADAIRPDPDRMRRRGALARDLGDIDAERRAYLVIPEDQLTGAEALRLVDLLAWSDDPDRADHLERIALQHLGRETSDQTDLAVALAVSAVGRGQLTNLSAAMALWARPPGRQQALGAVVPVLATRPDQARQLVLALASYDGSLRPALITAFARSGLGSVVRGLMVDHLDGQADLSEADWILLAEYADHSGDLSLLEARLATLSGTVPPAVFMPILRYRGAEGLTAYQRQLAAADLADLPILAAAWEGLLQRDGIAASWLIRAAQDQPDMAARDRALWRLVAQGLAPGTGLDFLRGKAASTPALAQMFTDRD